MASLIIRPASLSDAADLGIIHYQAWLQTYTCLLYTSSIPSLQMVPPETWEPTSL